MRALFLALLGLTGLLGLLLLGGRLGLLQGHRPADLGVTQGRLKAPSATPNSVSSQADLHPGHPQAAYARIAPLALQGRDPAVAMQVLAGVLRAMPGVTVVTQTPDYLHAEAETRWLRFVDDLEFWHDPAAQAIAVRSASRLGRKDFGVNRARIEAVRAAFETGGETGLRSRTDSAPTR